MSRKQKSTNYVYIAYSKLTPLQCKIGLTNNLEHRLNAFHTTDKSIRFVRVFTVYSRARVFELESQLHRRFKTSRSSRGEEWYNITLPLFLWLWRKGAIAGIVKFWLNVLWGSDNEPD